MIDENLTQRELEYLLIIDAYLNDPTNPSRIFPPSSVFMEYMKALKTSVSTYKGNLIRKGWLDVINGEVRLSPHAENFLQERAGAIRNTQVQTAYVPLPGEVSAGHQSHGELQVYARDIGDKVEDSIPIPSSNPLLDVVAYEVVGTSMEHDGIFEGDYVIVEVNPNKALQKGHVIVTKYLKTGETLDSDELRGPTLKFNKGVQSDANNDSYYLLGWKTTFVENPKEIRAGYIAPIGVVIGVYRDMTK